MMNDMDDTEVRYWLSQDDYEQHKLLRKQGMTPRQAWNKYRKRMARRNFRPTDQAPPK